MSAEVRGMKAVYSYYFPESRQAVKQVDEVLADKRFYLTQTPADLGNDIIAPLNLKDALILPARPNGTLDLDAMHHPVIEHFVESYKKIVPGLTEFTNRYPTSGSSEGIYKYLAELKMKGVNSIYVLEGEYEGYKEYGKIFAIDTIEVSADTDPSTLQPGFWFVSNPSARDGNIISQEKINAIAEAGHHIALDLAYVGDTKEQTFDVSHPNIDAVFFSLSKPYGLFWERIGFAFSREPIQSLYANKWFKDVRGLIVAANIVDKVGPILLHPKYEPVQRRIVQRIFDETGIQLEQSDVVLLAQLPDTVDVNEEQRQLLEIYHRGRRYRVCLTPYLEEEEQQSQK